MFNCKLSANIKDKGNIIIHTEGDKIFLISIDGPEDISIFSYDDHWIKDRDYFIKKYI